MRRHRLHPGHVYIADGKTSIWTVLKNGLALCLWDRRAHRGGMSHFTQTRTPSRRECSAHYGNVAIGTLIAHLLELGSRCEDLVAHLYGSLWNECDGDGGVPDEGDDRQNLELLRTILERFGIRIIEAVVHRDDGASTVHFDVTSGVVEYHRGGDRSATPSMDERTALSAA